MWREMVHCLIWDIGLTFWGGGGETEENHANMMVWCANWNLNWAFLDTSQKQYCIRQLAQSDGILFRHRNTHSLACLLFCLYLVRLWFYLTGYCKSAATRLLRLWVQIPPVACMFVRCECCVLSGRGLCDELITRPEES